VKLYDIDDAPWGDWYGRKLTARDLARLLRPYGVSPRGVTIKGLTLKGYQRADLYEAWTRYLSVTSVTSVIPQVNGLQPVTDNGYDPTSVTGADPVTSTITEVTAMSDTPAGDGIPWHLADEIVNLLAQEWGICDRREAGGVLRRPRRTARTRYRLALQPEAGEPVRRVHPPARAGGHALNTPQCGTMRISPSSRRRLSTLWITPGLTW
jgi:hypothetical protein